MSFRTDDHKNPTAFTVDIANAAHLVLGVDYEQGEPFVVNEPQSEGLLHANVKPTTYYTARLLGDPIELTIQVITAIGFFTSHGAQRWEYIGVPYGLWLQLSREQKIDVIGWMYHREGGTAMVGLFPNYQSFR